MDQAPYVTHVFYHSLYMRFEKHAFNTWYEKHEFTMPWKALCLHITTHALKLFFSRRTFYARSGRMYVLQRELYRLCIGFHPFLYAMKK